MQPSRPLPFSIGQRGLRLEPTLLSSAHKRALAVLAGDAELAEAPFSAEVARRMTGALQRVVATRLDSSAPSYRATLQNLEQTGVLHSYCVEVIEHLVQAFGSHHLARVVPIYNGHTTASKLMLAPALQALGAPELHVVSSATSGDGVALALMEWQLGGPFKIDRLEPSGNLEQDIARQRDVAQRTLLAAVRAAQRSGRTVIVDRCGFVVAMLHHEEIRSALASGRLRLIVHNADDRRAIRTLGAEAWGIDLSGGAMKHLEGVPVAREVALIAQRELRHAFPDTPRIGDFPVHIVGYGLLGRNLARALLERGMDEARLSVTDTDADACARARRDLGKVVHVAAQTQVQRTARAVVFVATNGPGIDETNAHAFADQSLVFALTSGGVGVNQAALMGAGARVSPGQARCGLSVRGPPRPGILDDRILTLRRADGGSTQLILTFGGHSPNLFEESWRDTYAITPAAISVAFAEAAALTRPGIAAPDRGRQRHLAGRYGAHGLGAWRPLNEGFLTDGPATLAEDLHAFTPSRRRRS